MSHDTEPTPKINIETPDVNEVRRAVDPDAKNVRRLGRGAYLGIAGGIAVTAIGVGAALGLGAGKANGEHNSQAPVNSDKTAEAGVVPGQVTETTPAQSPSPSEDPTNPANTITATPTETAPSSEQASTTEYSVTQADVQKYLAESDDDFRAMPDEQRVMVSLYAISMTHFGDGEGTLNQVANDWYKGSKNEADKLPETISSNNTAEEALHVAMYMRRVPFLVTKSDGVSWDENLADKAFWGTSVMNGSNDIPALINDAKQSVGSNNGMIINAYSNGYEGALKMPTQINSSEAITDSLGHKAYKINFNDSATGQPKDIIVSWVVASNGEGVWVPYQ